MILSKYPRLPLLLTIGILAGLHSLYAQSHVFGVTDFNYLSLSSNTNYELKVGMYDKIIVRGEYENKNDTLILTSFDFNNANNLSSTYKQVLINKYNKFLIQDSLIIPHKLLILKLPKPGYMATHEKKEGLKSDWYILSDGHVYYNLQLREDSVFHYTTGACVGRSSIEGTWSVDKNEITLNPNSDKHIETLQWISNNNKMRLYGNMLIGKNSDNNYVYLLKW
ncbi:MAG: hypothetical protein N4A74_26720 [Carboxylicivirga sp.]|jgi:hypothetical protein|nr:hypothetical protein [Carboxylicivirga sp.]